MKNIDKIVEALVAYEVRLERAMDLVSDLISRGDDVDKAIRVAAETCQVTEADIKALANRRFDVGLQKFIGGFLGVAMAVAITYFIF